MFKHSVRVPRLYKVAAKIAKEVTEGVGSIKQLVYEHQKKHPRIKALYALVTTLFQRSGEIESVLKRSQFLTKEPRSDPWLIKVLIVELLWGSKRLAGESKPEKTVLGYEHIFKAHLSDVSLAPDPDEISKATIKPRYVRVNTLFATLNEAIDGFRDDGWNLCKFFDKKNYKEFLSKVTSLAEDEFIVDIHVPNLLVFPPRTEFFTHPAYKNGSIVLQDKASCLPVHILGPEPGSVVLDMCAAPGMKTTQIAALINNEGTVYAVERDPRRFEILNKITASSGATCVKTINRDVLTCCKDDFPGVQYILVDPSCTGSGMTDRFQSEQEECQQRIEKLAGFQIKILRNALTRYPDAKRVVYSTCSIFPQENEDVVRQVLETNSTFKLVPAKQFVDDTWTNFGSPDFGDIGTYCLYTKPDEDFTNGFFVAVFERLAEGEQNDFFNTKIYNYKKHIQSQEKRRNKKQEECGQDIEQSQLDNDERRKKKNAKSGIFEDDQKTWNENNGSVEEHKNYITEGIGNMNDQTAGSSKKRKKNNAVVEEEQLTDKTEEKTKKKKRKVFHSELKENIELVEHKNRESFIGCTGTATESKGISIDKNDIKLSAMKSQIKNMKRSAVPKDISIEQVEQSDNIVSKKKKQRENKEANNDAVTVVNNSSEFPAPNICLPKKKKHKESHIECIRPATQSNEEVNLEKYDIDCSSGGIETEKVKSNTEPFDSELELIGVTKKKKKKNRENKEMVTVQSNDTVSVVNDGEYPLTEIHGDKKKKKGLRAESIGAATQSNEDSLEKYDIERSAVEVHTKKAKKSIEPHKGDLKVIEESANCVTKKKKKKHRENIELETTIQSYNTVSGVNDGNEYPLTEIHISKKKKKSKEARVESIKTDEVNPEEAIELSAAKVHTKKAKRRLESYNNELEVIEKSDNIDTKQKKKKHRESKELEGTIQNIEINDSREVSASKIHISERVKKNRE